MTQTARAARPRLRRVARGKPRALARKAASPRAATRGRVHVPTTINIEITNSYSTSSLRMNVLGLTKYAYVQHVMCS